MDSLKSSESFMKNLGEKAREAMLPYEVKKLLTVVTYQLPVPCGDCSVHLLIDKEGKVLSGFIMDGGRDAQRLKASHVVHYGLCLIAIIHKIERPYLRAWVVTHWDKDHFEGVLSLMESGLLNRFVILGDFWLYCASDDKAIKQASNALANAKIKENIVIGSNVIGHDFFGQEPDKAQVGFWCVGGDAYSYTKGSFKLPPKPSKENERPTKLVLECKSGKGPTPNEKSLMGAIIWPNLNGMARYSYFCAGDGNVLLEKNKVCPEVFQSDKVTAFKLDHHGSSGEFAGGEVLKCMNLPQRLIVTPGHQYGHPCWDVLFQVSKMYKEAKQVSGGKLLYTTRLPYWIDERKFGKWANRDVNINHERLTTIESIKASSPQKKMLSGKETTKGFSKILKDVSEKGSEIPHWVEVMKGPSLKEEDDEDESNDPDYLYEDALADLLDDVVKNQGASYDSIYDRVTQELKAAVDKGKDKGRYAMEEEHKDMVEEKPSKPVEERSEIIHDVVAACVDMWNTISEQRIVEEVPQATYYLLQMISANDGELDGVIHSYEWPEIGEWKPKAHI
ncbi:hypothetical protein LB504_001360 [Fusarium proliferatum]|nr:hypothetical protein LB504_001360 [Fusarium proliferatum]